MRANGTYARQPACEQAKVQGFGARAPARLDRGYEASDSEPTYAAGEMIVRQGDASAEMFIVQSGEVVVLSDLAGDGKKGKPAEIARLGRGLAAALAKPEFSASDAGLARRSRERQTELVWLGRSHVERDRRCRREHVDLDLPRARRYDLERSRRRVVRLREVPQPKT